MDHNPLLENLKKNLNCLEEEKLAAMKHSQSVQKLLDSRLQKSRNHRNQLLKQQSDIQKMLEKKRETLDRSITLKEMKNKLDLAQQEKNNLSRILSTEKEVLAKIEKEIVVEMDDYEKVSAIFASLGETELISSTLEDDKEIKLLKSDLEEKKIKSNALAKQKMDIEEEIKRIKKSLNVGK